MCTILKYKHCMGRNFDYEVSYNEELRFIESDKFNLKYNIIGMCTGIIQDYPLLYDGMNQCGLCMGGLAFTGNAYYIDPIEVDNEGKKVYSIPSYNFILFILGNFSTVASVEEYIKEKNCLITNEQYNDDMPPSDLHWFVCDKDKAIVIEQTVDGLQIHQAITGVLTNNPPYQKQIDAYHFSSSLVGDVSPSLCNDEWYSRGRETDGLAGGYASDERFERVSFLKSKLESANNNFDDVGQTFHLLTAAEQMYGITVVDDKFEYTIYSVVYNMDDKMVYLQDYNGKRNSYMY